MFRCPERSLSADQIFFGLFWCSLNDSWKKFLLAALIASVTLFLVLLKANQSSGTFECLAFLRRRSRFFISFRISGDNHFGFVLCWIHFRLSSAFASMALLRREYQPFTMSSTSSKTKIMSHGVSYNVLINLSWSKDLRYR